jgi:hypothetical protein
VVSSVLAVSRHQSVMSLFFCTVVCGWLNIVRAHARTHTHSAEGFGRFRLPEFITFLKVGRLPDLCTSCLYSQGRFLALISLKRLSRFQGHSVGGRVSLIKNPEDPMGN